MYIPIVKILKDVVPKLYYVLDIVIGWNHRSISECLDNRPVPVLQVPIIWLVSFQQLVSYPGIDSHQSQLQNIMGMQSFRNANYSATLYFYIRGN